MNQDDQDEIHDQAAVDDFMDVQYGPRGNQYNLRERPSEIMDS